MPRVPRRLLGEGVYHVLNRGLNRARVLEVPGGKDTFVALLREYRKRLPIRFLHWVVMGNHFHLVLEALKGRDLSAFMAGLQRRYTAYHHRLGREAKQDACGYLWQGRFKSPMVERDTHLFACGRYIERNPVRAGLVEEPWAYVWSSARAYALGEDDGVTDVAFNGSYLSLGKETKDRQAEWRAYLTQVPPEQEEALFRGAHQPVGTGAFIAKLVTRDGRMTAAHPGIRKDKGHQQDSSGVNS